MTQAQASHSAATMDIAGVEAEARRKIRARRNWSSACASPSW
jgi:NitT/TauT family transport system permease protein